MRWWCSRKSDTGTKLPRRGCQSNDEVMVMSEKAARFNYVMSMRSPRYAIIHRQAQLLGVTELPEHRPPSNHMYTRGALIHAQAAGCVRASTCPGATPLFPPFIIAYRRVAAWLLVLVPPSKVRSRRWM
jgi:hypothetical protein